MNKSTKLPSAKLAGRKLVGFSLRTERPARASSAKLGVGEKGPARRSGHAKLADKGPSIS